MIALGCDHGGYELKQEIIKYLEENNIEYKDFGCDSTDSTDYPIYAKRVAIAIQNGDCEKGILICGTGIGISITANKFKGIRAALCSDCFSAEATRLHNNANILAMGGRVVGPGLAVSSMEYIMHDTSQRRDVISAESNRSKRIQISQTIIRNLKTGEVFTVAVHIKKREDYISWDEYFMGVAMLSGMRSKDPNSQVGACIVSNDNKILSMGYNGFPKGCSDDEFPWAREGDPLDTKYLYVTHSELNAILNYRGGSLEGAKLYVSLFPCNECAKAIIQAGIKTVVYDCDKYEHTPSVIASKRMLDAAGVRYYKYNRTGREIKLSV
mgnify:CR=1 FL=1